MARSAKASDLKAKEAKQKKLLAVLVVVLVAVGAIQVPKLTKSRAAAPPPPPPPATTATPSASTPAALPAPAVSAPAGSTAAASGFADTNVPPAADAGQLVRFDLFSSKDPFVQQVTDVAAGSQPAPKQDAGAGGKPKPDGAEQKGPFSPAGGSSEPSVPQTRIARISVDKAAEEVVPGRDFPAAAPVFHLESVTASAAKVSIVGGSYQDGSAAITLAKGKAVTLENTYDGTRYVLVYLGSKQVPTASVPPPPTTSTAATTTTTPALAPAAG